jgi:hypothetical protein
MIIERKETRFTWNNMENSEKINPKLHQANYELSAGGVE